MITCIEFVKREQNNFLKAVAKATVFLFKDPKSFKGLMV